MTLYEKDSSGEIRKVILRGPEGNKKITAIHWLMLAAGAGIALSPEIGELAGWHEIEHPSHFADIMAAVCGAMLAWCSRFVQ
jgi:hypothetical protein